MTANAFSLDRWHVRPVLESKVLAGKLGATSHVRFSMASATVSLVMGLFVTANAISTRWQVKWTLFTCTRDSCVTLDAVDPLRHVCTMLERVRRRLATGAEHAGARADHQRSKPRERKASVHGISRARETRRIALVSNV